MNIEQDGQEPAFPVVASTGDPRDGVYCRNGITIRDYFAAKIAAGMWSSSGLKDTHHIAKTAYEQADAMLKARKVNQ